MAKQTDSLSNLWRIPELEKEHAQAKALLEKWISEVTAASKKLREMQLSIPGMGNMSEMAANAKKVEALTNQQLKSIKALADAKLKEAKAEEVLSRARLNAAKEVAIADRAELANKKELERQAKINAKAQEELAKKQQRATVEAAKANNAYELLKKQYREAANEAKRLGAELGVGDARFKAAAASAHAMHTQLLNIEMSVGQAQRQVGNYNVVGAQFNQLLREAPNAGLGMRTFVMSISNNITYFAEAVQQAKKEGQSWGAILGTMGKSLFSVVGIINIAVTALTFITMSMTKSEAKTKDLAEETDNLADAIIRVIDAERDLAELRQDKARSSSEAQLKREIDLLKAQGASSDEIFEAEQRYFKKKAENLRDEADTYNTLIKDTDRFFKFYKGQKLSQEELDKKVTEALTKSLQEYTLLSDKEAKQQAENIVKSYGDAGGAYADLNKKRLQLLSQARDTENEININSIEFQRDLNEDIKKEDEKSLKEQEKAYKDYMQRRRNTEKEKGGMGMLPTLEEIQAQIKEIENSGLSNRLQMALFGIDQEESNALKALEIQYSKGLIAGEAYEAEKLRIQNDYATKRIQLEIDTTKKLLANGGLDEGERLKLIARINELELELAKQGNDEKLNAEKEAAKESLKIEEERAKEIQRIREQLTTAALSAVKVIADAQNARSDNYIKGLEREKDEVTVMEERERARAERTIENEQEREDRIAVIEAQADARRKQIEDRIKGEQIRKAQREKELALFNIAANLYTGVSKEIATKGVAGLATGASIIAYVGALLAAVSALSIPTAYAEGTPEGGHKGGSALVGEAGEAEYVKEPGKAGYWVTKPTLFKNMAKGTEVTPLHKLDATGIDGIDARGLNAVMLQGGGNSAKTEELLSQILSESKRKPPVYNTTIKGDALQTIVARGNTIERKLRERL